MSDATMIEVRRLVVEAAPLVLRLLAIGVYLRIDQIMVGRLLGDAATGVYVAALRLVELWYFIANAVMMVVVPRLAQIHHFRNDVYDDQLVKVIRLLIWSSVAMAIVMSLCAAWIVPQVYGPKYAAAVPVLMVGAWGAVFSTLGQTVSAWFVNMRLVRYGIYQALLGAVTCVIVGMILIPRIGIVGAACASVAAQFVSGFASNALFAVTRPIMRLQLRAVAGIR